MENKELQRRAFALLAFLRSQAEGNGDNIAGHAETVELLMSAQTQEPSFPAAYFENKSFALREVALESAGRLGVIPLYQQPPQLRELIRLAHDALSEGWPHARKYQALDTLRRHLDGRDDTAERRLSSESQRMQEQARTRAAGFPERDTSKPAEEQGMFRKFEVRRVDGSDQYGGKHYGCRYFVLDMNHDAHAPAALRAYAESCAESHPKLAADLRAEFGEKGGKA